MCHLFGLLLLLIVKEVKDAEFDRVLDEEKYHEEGARGEQHQCFHVAMGVQNTVSRVPNQLLLRLCVVLDQFIYYQCFFFCFKLLLMTTQVFIKELHREALQIFVYIVIDFHQQAPLSSFTIIVDQEFSILELHEVIEVFFHDRLVHGLESLKTVVHNGLLILFVEKVRHTLL